MIGVSFVLTLRVKDRVKEKLCGFKEGFWVGFKNVLEKIGLSM